MSFQRFLVKQMPQILKNGRKRYHNLAIVQNVNHPNLKVSNFSLPIRHNYQKSIKCWQCGITKKNISELFCEQCHFIQSPQVTDNYFKIFELEEQFNINQKELTQKYRQLQSQLHPDKFSNKSSEEKHISEEFSSLVNKAYNTLQTPLKRAIHLLHLKGGVIEEGQKIENPEFLMEIMELNEEVESADDADKVIKLRNKNREALKQISDEIQTAFDNNQIDKAKNLIIKMKYYNSVSVHINTLMREKGISD